MLPRVHTFIALLLLSLWLPATMHCALESAGILPSHADAPVSSCAQTGGPCTNDSCTLVEGVTYKAASTALQIPAPSVQLTNYLCWVRDVSANGESLAVAAFCVPRAQVERPKDWVASWQFIRRAAPSPRAPSFAVA